MPHECEYLPVSIFIVPTDLHKAAFNSIEEVSILTLREYRAANALIIEDSCDCCEFRLLFGREKIVYS